MPEYEVIVDGKPRRIQLTQPTQNLFTAKIDDTSHKIEIRTDKINPEEVFTIKIALGMLAMVSGAFLLFR